MSTTHWIELGLGAVMLLVPSVVLYFRMKPKSKDDSSPTGIGVRIIQLLALFLFLPLIGILTLEGKISGETAGALLGVTAGYTLSGVEEPVPSKD